MEDARKSFVVATSQAFQRLEYFLSEGGHSLKCHSLVLCYAAASNIFK